MGPSSRRAQAQTDAKAALGKVLKTPDPGGKIVSLIEGQSKSDGHPINYQQDVAPWLGEKAGFFFTDLGQTAQKGAAVIETDEPGGVARLRPKASGATATNPAPQTYNGASYQTDPSSSPARIDGLRDGRRHSWSRATSPAFKAAVDASKGDSLGDDERLQGLHRRAAERPAGTLYTVPKNLIDSIGLGAQFGPAAASSSSRRVAGDSLDKPVAGALTATRRTASTRVTGGSNGVDTPESSLIGDVPAQSWLALGIGNLGDTAKRTARPAQGPGSRTSSGHRPADPVDDRLVSSTSSAAPWAMRSSTSRARRSRP